ncbi:MAG TPA: hypothetical protein VJ836_04645 [Candidatus Saccharimonadales bacterium]|nr:hypothetical protein [Candidatus Saccharimonadales bacterium]
MIAPLVVALVVIIASIVYRHIMPTKINPAAYAPLLNTIAKGESNSNYNAHFGNAANTTIRFTEMTVSDVLRWQEDFVRQGSVSSAVGKYQIIRPTLAGLVRQLGVDTRLPFDETLQDKMAITLLERRGAVAYIEKKLTREQFAANLAKEWAALPKVVGNNPEESYYANDGINKARISIDEISNALAKFETQADDTQTNARNDSHFDSLPQ